MVCRTFRAAVDSYVDGSASQSRRRAMDEHAAGCPQCRADLAVARLLARGPAPQGGDADEDLTPGDLARAALQPSVTRLAHQIIAQALRDRATEILLDPVSEGLNVTYRIGEELHEVITMPGYVRQPLAARLKQMADLSMTERRVPQQGDISVRMDDQRYRVRIVTHPKGEAERIVMEIEYPGQQEDDTE